MIGGVMDQWNIILRNKSGTNRLEIGKICRLGYEHVYHYWADPKDKRHSQDAWGMREAVLAHCLDNEVIRFYMYDKVANMTYGFEAPDLLRHGIRGKEDEYGRTI